MSVIEIISKGQTLALLGCLILFHIFSSTNALMTHFKLLYDSRQLLSEYRLQIMHKRPAIIIMKYFYWTGKKKTVNGFREWIWLNDYTSEVPAFGCWDCNDDINSFFRFVGIVGSSFMLFISLRTSKFVPSWRCLWNSLPSIWNKTQPRETCRKYYLTGESVIDDIIRWLNATSSQQLNFRSYLFSHVIR